MLQTFIITLGILQTACALKIHVHHRLFVPTSTESAPFVPKGSVELDYALDSQVYTTYIPSNSATRDLTNYIKNLADRDSSALYQVALEVPDVPQDLWPFSSVGACHLPATNGERITLHTLHSTTPHPYALDYWLISTTAPDNGGCPSPSSASTSGSSAFDATNWNTTIVIKAPTTPPVPPLRVPPPLTPEGKPMEVKPEPSFISKYWMYLVGGFIFLTFILPVPEEEGPKEGGSSGSKS